MLTRSQQRNRTVQPEVDGLPDLSIEKVRKSGYGLKGWKNFLETPGLPILKSPRIRPQSGGRRLPWSNEFSAPGFWEERVVSINMVVTSMSHGQSSYCISASATSLLKPPEGSASLTVLLSCNRLLSATSLVPGGILKVYVSRCSGVL